MSSNLISRSTVNAFTKSFLLQLILDTQYEYLGSFLLYWKFSPDTNADRAFLVFPFGSVNTGNSGRDDVTDSYGNFILQSYIILVK